MWTFSTVVTGAIGATTTSGVVPGAFGNPKIGPERQSELEGGIDLDGWSGRLHTELTGYARKSTDALIQIPIATSAGGGSVYRNVGSVTNRGFEAPKGEVYGCIETANGELGYYIVSDGGHFPWRARTRPCSFINYSVFPKMIEGHMISDVVAILGSINVIAAELDR